MPAVGGNPPPGLQELTKVSLSEQTGVFRTSTMR